MRLLKYVQRQGNPAAQHRPVKGSVCNLKAEIWDDDNEGFQNYLLNFNDYEF